MAYCTFFLQSSDTTAATLKKDHKSLASLARFRAGRIEVAYKQANDNALTALRTNRRGDFGDGVKFVKEISEDRQQTLAYAEKLSRGG